MSYHPPQTASYKTNVNRAKTKRWVEAKSVSYDGDDWGDVDEYDEYGGYDQPPPPQKPTGLRQRGQSANQQIPVSGNVLHEDQQSSDNAKHEFGNLGQSVAQQASGRGTDSQPQTIPRVLRSNSFDRGDEKRAFSATGHQQSIPPDSTGAYDGPDIRQGQNEPPHFTQASIQAPPPQQGPYQPFLSQIDPQSLQQPQRGPLQTLIIPSNVVHDGHFQPPLQFYPEHKQNLPEPGRPPLHIESQSSWNTDRRNLEQKPSPTSNYRGVPYPDQPRNSSLGSRAQSMASNNPSLDFHNRRDFSPSAIPPPLQTRNSPSPHDGPEAQLFAHHPPRKSSLSQGIQPNIGGLDQAAQLPPPTAVGGHQTTTSNHPSNNDSTKPLPFVRPADIYKRMQEEREKEMQSPDSSRPSTDIHLERSTEDELLIVRHHAVPHSSVDSSNIEPLSTDIVGNTNLGESSQILRKALEPVAEQKSEHDFDAFRVEEQKLEADRTGASAVSHQNTPRPILPDVTRMSDFGGLLLSTGLIAEEQSLPVSQEPMAFLPQSAPDAPSQDGTGASLQHQPSLGFRSVVHQAFDQIPETPSSVAGSGIGRRTSVGTSAVSPILSRDASLAERTRTAKDPEESVLTPQATANEDDSKSSRHMSSSTTETPKNIVRKPSPSESPRQGLSEPIPPTFIPGHRRNFSTPSPEGSPARTPILETNWQTRKPQEAELAMATPTEPGFLSVHAPQPRAVPISHNTSATSHSGPDQGNEPGLGPRPTMPNRLTTPGAPNVIDTSMEQRENNATDSPVSQPSYTTLSRADSPSKNRVRDLAGKFESGGSSPRGSDLSIGLPGRISPKKDNVPQARPPADRLESFRPHLPGGWESYASTTPAEESNRRVKSVEDKPIEQMELKNAPDLWEGTSSTLVTAPSESQSKTSKTPESLLPQVVTAQPSTDPFAAVAAAGSALGEALLAAVSMDREESPVKPDAPHLQKEQEPSEPLMTNPRSPTTTVHPEASQPPIPSPADDEKSGGQPMPPWKDFAEDAEKTSASSTNASSEVTSQKVLPEELYSVEDPANPNPQSMLPPLSTDIRSHRYESDRLRREIVKNLSPRGISEPTTAESESPWQDDSRLSADPSFVAHGHDSMALPSEYDSYWNGSNNASRTNSGHITFVSIPEPDQQFDDGIIKPPQPLHLSNEQQNKGTGDTTGGGGSLQKSYSWEVESGESRKPVESKIGPVTTNQPSIPPAESHNYDNFISEAPVPPTMNKSSIPPPESRDDEFINEAPIPPAVNQFSIPPPASHDDDMFINEVPGPPSMNQSSIPPPESRGDDKFINEVLGPPTLNQTFIPPTESRDDDKFINEVPGSTTHRAQSLRLVHDDALGKPEQSSQSAASTSTRVLDMSEKELVHQGQESGMEKKFTSLEEGPSLPPYPDAPVISQYPTVLIGNRSAERDSDHQAIGSGFQNEMQLQPGHLEQLLQIKSASEYRVASINSPLPLAPSAQPKIPAFREIIALKTPAERIRAFNDTREQFAMIDQGLSHWLAVKSNEMPEHASGLFLADVPSAAVAGQKPSPFKTKIPGLRSSGGQQSQQPYFQQYLNATPQASGSEGIGGQPASGSNSSQSLPPTGGTTGKSSTQQVQAKGKDFLHSAGLFGGKANVAAKGLFSKGRSKLRGSSGVDKVANPTLSPDPFSTGIQPQHQPQPHHQPQTEQPLQNQIPYEPQPILQEASIFQSKPSQPYAPSVGPPPLSRESTPDQSQSSQSSQTDEENQLPGSKNTTSPPSLNDEPTVPGLVRPPRSSSLLSKNFDQNTPATAPRNEPVQKAIVGDNTPISLHTTPAPESNVGSPPEIQRRYSDASGNQTPTQADFNRPGQSGGTLGSALSSEKASFQEKSDSEVFIESESAVRSSPPQISEAGKIYPRERLVPHSRYSTHKLLSTDTSRGEPEKLPKTEPRSGLQPQPVLLQGPVPRGASPGQRTTPSPVNSLHVTPIAGVSDQRATRPFSFIEPSPNEANQHQPETLEREPSMESNLSSRFQDRPPSPVSPQRSLTQISDRHEQIEQSSYGPQLSYSRPFQDPNLETHPAFRQGGPPGVLPPNATGLSFEYYKDQIPRTEARMPRQQTTEYQIEGVGPSPIPHIETETETRSRQSTRGSAFFRNMPRPEGTQRTDSSEDQVAESPAQATGKKSKRNSVFRTLTGRSGGDRDQKRGSVDKPAMPPTPPPPQIPVPRQYNAGPPTGPAPISAKIESGASTSVATKKLQRASTSVAAEKNVGKKKRFSAIGTLFGRSSHEKPRSPTQTRQQSQQSSAQPFPPFRQSQPPNYPAQPTRQDANSYQYPTPFRQDPKYHPSAPPQEYVPPPQDGYYAPDPTPSRATMPPPSAPVAPAAYPKQGPEPPAYIQDASLRQPGFRSPSDPTTPRASATPLQPSETYFDRSGQLRRSHWVRTPSMQQAGSTVHASPNTEDVIRPARRDSAMQNNNNMQPSFQQFIATAPNAYSTTPPQPPPHHININNNNASPKMYDPPTVSMTTINQRSNSPAPPLPPPKDNVYSPPQSQPSSLRSSQQFAAAAVAQKPQLPQFTTTTAPSRSPPLPLQTPPQSQTPTPTSARSALPPIQTALANSSSNSSSSGKLSRDKNARRSRQMEIERGGMLSAAASPPPEKVKEERVLEEDEEEEGIVMSSTAYPGQEWTPTRYERWDDGD